MALSAWQRDQSKAEPEVATALSAATSWTRWQRDQSKTEPAVAWGPKRTCQPKRRWRWAFASGSGRCDLGRSFGIVGLGLLMITLGCQTAWWPLGGKVSDTVPGVLPPSEHIATLRQLAKQASGGGPGERERIAQQVAAALPMEPDPLIRIEMVRTLGACSGAAAEAALRQAAKDPDADVRVAACRAWARLKGPSASEVLRERLASDTDIDVRLAAAEGLGELRDPASLAALGTVLEDPDPALQYRAVASLRKVAPVDLGNDVDRWRQYVKDGTIAPARSVSLAERLGSLF